MDPWISTQRILMMRTDSEKIRNLLQNAVETVSRKKMLLHDLEIGTMKTTRLRTENGVLLPDRVEDGCLWGYICQPSTGEMVMEGRDGSLYIEEGMRIEDVWNQELAAAFCLDPENGLSMTGYTCSILHSRLLPEHHLFEHTEPAVCLHHSYDQILHVFQIRSVPVLRELFERHLDLVIHPELAEEFLEQHDSFHPEQDLLKNLLAFTLAHTPSETDPDSLPEPVLEKPDLKRNPVLEEPGSREIMWRGLAGTGTGTVSFGCGLDLPCQTEWEGSVLLAATEKDDPSLALHPEAWLAFSGSSSMETRLDPERTVRTLEPGFVRWFEETGSGYVHPEDLQIETSSLQLTQDDWPYMSLPGDPDGWKADGFRSARQLVPVRTARRDWILYLGDGFSLEENALMSRWLSGLKNSRQEDDILLALLKGCMEETSLKQELQKIPDLIAFTLPEGFRHLEAGTFAGLETLQEVTLPDTLEQIDGPLFAEGNRKVTVRCSRDVARLLSEADPGGEYIRKGRLLPEQADRQVIQEWPVLAGKGEKWYERND